MCSTEEESTRVTNSGLNAVTVQSSTYSIRLTVVHTTAPATDIVSPEELASVIPIQYAANFLAIQVPAYDQ
ncbi:hypothetical protein D3C73_1628890 [compost metagenome]